MLPSTPSVDAAIGVGVWILLAVVFLLVAYQRTGRATRYELAGWTLLGAGMTVTGLTELSATVNSVDADIGVLALSLVIVGIGSLLVGRRRGKPANAGA